VSGRVSFGAFELDLETGELRKGGRILKLQPQPLRVLCLLISRSGKLVSREEIRRLLWGESTFVDYDVGVDYCMNRIRSVLCDKARAPRYVETLRRRGYRFVAPIKRYRPFVEPTLAVLPFENLNGDPAREYFADGVTDALITELARIKAVRVISRQSVLHLKGSNRKLDEIARDLDVDGFVEGAVLQEGNRVRVTAQLVLMEPERHAWAQSYDCDVSAVLTTQRDAARSIAGCVATALRPAGAEVPASVAAGPGVTPVAPEIIEASLKALTELGKMSAEGIGKALQYFREITVKAPGFAPGLAWHSGCLIGLGYWGHAPICETYPSAKQLALNALTIDDSLDIAHLSLGMTNWLLDWDLAAAEREFRRAIELGPSNPDTHTFYGIFLGSVGRFSDSIAEGQYALKLDPTSLLANTALAWGYLNARQPGKAEAQARRTIESFPDSLHAHFVLGLAAWCLRKAADSVAAFEKALSLSREAFSLAFLGHVYGRLGRGDEAQGLLRELDRLFTQGQAPPIAFVVICAGLGDTDAAFNWLETAYRLRDDKMFWLTGMPLFDPLRSDPRYAVFLHRMGLAPVDLTRTR
jgi:TolB-like protein/tetratricopeptide (TPR) repeat protein